MSQSVFKKIRRYAKLRNLDYNFCKKVFSLATPEEKKIYIKEMENASFNTPLLDNQK